MNNFGQHLRNSEYKTKNQDVFTWNQNLIHLNRMSMPEFQKPLDADNFAKAYEKATNELKQLELLGEHFNPTNITDLYHIPHHMIDLLGLKNTDNTVDIECRNHNKEPKNLINEPPPSKKKEQILKKLERLEKKYQKKNLNSKSLNRNNLSMQNKLIKDAAGIIPVKLPYYDFLSVHKPKEPFFDDSKCLQREKDKHRNGEFFIVTKNKKNVFVNKVLANINKKDKEINKDDITNNINKNVDKTIGQMISI